jgi:peptidoglycan/LPS O-acetylase OafA/YrhL
VLLSAILLGATLTTLPLSDYFSSPLLASYLLNMVGDIHYLLPGVFLNNPVHGTVNLSLWTVPFELQCYLLLMLLAWFRLFRRPVVFCGVSILFNLALWLAYFILKPHGPPSAETLTMPGPGLVISFLAGISIYLLRHRIPLRAWMAALCLAVALALLHEPRFMVLAIFPAAYLTVWVGLTHPRSSLIIRSGDYSYGIYVFAFPIQQALAGVPMFRPWYVNMPAAFVLCFLYAIFSWHVVEKPVLDQKKLAVAFVESIGLRLRRRLRPVAVASRP